MRDKDNGLALLLPFFDLVKKPLDLTTVEAGRRFIEDDQPRFKADGLENFDDLLLVRRQRGNRRVGM